jgi:DNA-directed RNA polymerase subunit RPC12/RpoP
MNKKSEDIYYCTKCNADIFKFIDIHFSGTDIVCSSCFEKLIKENRKGEENVDTTRSIKTV